MRQNSLEDVKGTTKNSLYSLNGFFSGLETLKSVEELDLSDNFITLIPEQIRQLSALKRVGMNMFNGK